MGAYIKIPEYGPPELAGTKRSADGVTLTYTMVPTGHFQLVSTYLVLEWLIKQMSDKQ